MEYVILIVPLVIIIILKYVYFVQLDVQFAHHQQTVQPALVDMPGYKRIILVKIHVEMESICLQIQLQISLLV